MWPWPKFLKGLIDDIEEHITEKGRKPPRGRGEGQTKDDRKNGRKTTLLHQISVEITVVPRN
jgi:hypothetical protein